LNAQLLIVNCWCDWVKQKCVSNCSGWHAMWRTLRKTLTMFFSVVSYRMKIMFYTAVFTRTKRPWLWTATLSPWT